MILLNTIFSVIVFLVPAIIRGEDGRQRQLRECDETPRWHPQYSRAWKNGYCRYTADCDSPGWSTELECCNSAYAGQMSGYCIFRLPFPPTSSPTDSSYTIEFWYPRYEELWPDSGCSNRLPLPFNLGDRPVYDSQIECCKAAYIGQMSGKCLSELEAPPTSSPTMVGGIGWEWWPEYNMKWSEAGCSNKVPWPFNKGDRPTYDTQLECCKSAYSGQTSQTCLHQLESPPTSSPTGAGGGELYYPDYATAWDKAGCINKLPIPIGRPTYTSQKECCKFAYPGQVSNTCICSLTDEVPPIVCFKAVKSRSTLSISIPIEGLTVPSTNAERAALIPTLVTTITDLVNANLSPVETLIGITIISINGESVRRSLRHTPDKERALSNELDIIYEAEFEYSCNASFEGSCSSAEEEVVQSITQVTAPPLGNALLSISLTQAPSKSPNAPEPSKPPTQVSTQYPTAGPSVSPTKSPQTSTPSSSPSASPSSKPFTSPSLTPTNRPQMSLLTKNPTKTPSLSPSKTPSFSPSNSPQTSSPTKSPSRSPTSAPLTDTASNWNEVSPVLAGDSTLLALLPNVPSAEDVSNQLYTEEVLSTDPFQLYKISNFPETAGLCNDNEGVFAAQAGPKITCTADNCNGPSNQGYTLASEHCAAVINKQSIQLRSKLGTYWSKALNTPSWMQFTFPAVPTDSTEFIFSIKLDNRYRPELFGGNPCDSAPAECDLCKVEGPWDYSMQAGVHVLWSAAGRERYVVTGPFDLVSAFDSDKLVQNFKSPAELNLQPGDFPIVSLLVVFQYPSEGEVLNPSSCSIAQSDESNRTYKDKPLMIEYTSLMYRSGLDTPSEPAVTRPRLYGSDETWMSSQVTPFFDVPCDPNVAKDYGGGWFEAYGYFNMKNHFDLAARGFDSCTTSADADIGSWFALSDYFSDNVIPDRQTYGYRAFHLLRRLWYCASQNSGDYSMCEYSETETNRLAAAVATKEMQRFGSTTWTCGATCGGNGDVAFDLTTSEQVNFFVYFYDVFEATGLLSQDDLTSLSTTLEQQIEVFKATFMDQKWQLWNGNNWTPHLCHPAMAWAITFWHEKNDLAKEVLAIVNDIMWLHRNYYTNDGDGTSTYTEGVAVYAFMSVQGQSIMATLSRASFGYIPAAIDVETISGLASYFDASMSRDGHFVDFGDSHRKRGWGSPLPFITAAIAPAIFNGETISMASINSVQARAFSATAYGSGGFYANPWYVHGEILQFDALTSLRTTLTDESRPLGGKILDVFTVGGYARIQLPLLEKRLTNVCFKDKDGAQNNCIDPDLPSLWDNIPYAGVYLQARPNTYAHSEVDFGTLTWSAWGARLLSEYGYGTIATSVNKFDMRRYQYLDNNAAGHNTVIIREAFLDGSETINFSQLNYVTGTMSSEITFTDGSTCVLMDGSENYGASRGDGWLDMMKRFVCAMEGGNGSVLLLDLIQTKKNRGAMSLYGSQYDGLDFEEPAPASQELTIDEYFYTDTEAEITVTDGKATEVLPYERGSTKRCEHVDVEVQSDPALVALRPACGMGGYRDADGLGVISGLSVAANGQFVYDGLVTSVNRWFTEHALRKRRFRFVTDKTVNSTGDVRAFVLSPSLATDPLQLPPKVKLQDCSAEHGCDGVSPVDCSCIHACLGSELKLVTINNGSIADIENIEDTLGYCTASFV